MITYGLFWKENILKMHKGVATLHPRGKQNKEKEPIQPNGSDTAADDELSSGSTLLPDLPPPKNNVEVESRKRPPHCSSRSVSGMPRRVRREFSRERWQSEHAPKSIPAWQRGATPSLSFGYPTFGDAPTPYMLAPTTIRGP